MQLRSGTLTPVNMQLRSGRITRSTSPPHTTSRRSTGYTNTLFYRVPGSNLCRHCGRTESEHEIRTPPAPAHRVIKKAKINHSTSASVIGTRPIQPYSPSPYMLFYLSMKAHVPGTSFYNCNQFLSNLWKSMRDDERKVWEDKARASANGYQKTTVGSIDAARNGPIAVV